MNKWEEYLELAIEPGQDEGVHRICLSKFGNGF